MAENHALLEMERAKMPCGIKYDSCRLDNFLTEFRLKEKRRFRDTVEWRKNTQGHIWLLKTFVDIRFDSCA